VGARTWAMRCKGKDSCGWRWDQPLTGAPTSPVHCPRCRKAQRVPKLAWDGVAPASARPARAKASALPVRTLSQPRQLGVQAQPPMPPVATGPGDELAARIGELAAGLIAGGNQPAAWALEPAAVIPPARPPAVAAGQDAGRSPATVVGLLGSRQRVAELGWPGAVPSAVRWCAACRAERQRTAAKYQAELSVAPFAADLCGNCLARLWREVPQAVVVACRLPALSKRAAKPAEDALLLRLAAAGLRVPGLAGLVPA
jgi:hypothetical protein